MTVLDASLAAKLVFQEAESEAAEHWYLNVADEIVAPDLLAVEIAQAIVRRVNAQLVDRVSGQDAIRAWRTILERGGVTLVRTEPVHVEAAADLAMRLGHPVKDCLYLALAMELGGDLATCDAKFITKAQTVYPAVRHLSDYPAANDH